MRVSLAAIALCAVALGCGAPTVRPITLDAAPRATRFQTANGLGMVLEPDANASSVVVAVRYHVGHKDDPAGKSGLAHLVEHLSFAVEAEPGKDVAAAYEQIGAASSNGGVGLDATDYVVSLPPSMLEKAIALEAERMAKVAAAIDDAALARERAIVRTELRTRSAEAPFRIAATFLATEVFGDAHPYGHVSRASDLDRIGVDDARAFAERFYRPSNATLVVSGRFEPARARDVIVASFGAIPTGPPREHRTIAPPKIPKSRSLFVRAPVPWTTLAVAWTIPPVETDAHEALELARDALEPALVTRMTTKHAVADDVDVRIGGGHFGAVLQVFVRLRPGSTAEGALTEIDRALVATGELGRIHEWDDFEEFRRRSATRRALAATASGGRAVELLYDVEYVGELRSPAAVVERIEHSTANDVGSAVRQFLVDAPRVVVIVEPDPAAPAEGARR